MMRSVWRRALACLVLVLAVVTAMAQSLTIGDLNKNIGDYVNKDVAVKGIIQERGENPDPLGDLKNRILLKDPSTNATLEVLTNASLESIPKIGEPFEAKGTVKMKEGNLIFMESRGGINLLVIALVVLGAVAIILIYLIMRRPQGRQEPVSVVSSPSPSVSSAPAPAPTLMATCPHCGEKTPAGKPFCKECGKPLTEAPKAPSVAAVADPPTRADEGPTRADHVVATLTLKQGNVVGKTRDSQVDLSGKGLSFGRAAKRNDVVMPDDNVSNDHAKLEVSGTEVNLVDQGSTNGTFVNGSRVTRQSLADGDEIRIGDNVFVFSKKSPGG